VTVVPNTEQDVASQAIEHGTNCFCRTAPLPGGRLELHPVAFTLGDDAFQLFEVHVPGLESQLL
jgi:hypothetical protein